MKISLIQLERCYLTALQQYGPQAKQTQLATNNLVRQLVEGKRKALTQRAIEVLRDCETFSESLLEARYLAYLQMASIYENELQYRQAYELLQELLPLPDYESLRLRQVQVLYHLVESGRQLRVYEYGEQLLDLMDRVGLNLLGFKKYDKKYHMMLVRAYYLEAKHNQRSGKEQQAVEYFYQAQKLGEEVFGAQDVLTQKARRHYEELCEKLDICIQIEEEVPQAPKYSEAEKPAGRNYKIIVNQIYVKRHQRIVSGKLDKEKEDSRKSLYSDLKRFWQGSRPASAKTTTTKFPSPRSAGATMFQSTKKAEACRPAAKAKRTSLLTQQQSIPTDMALEPQNVYQLMLPRPDIQYLVRRPAAKHFINVHANANANANTNSNPNQNTISNCNTNIIVLKVPSSKLMKTSSRAIIASTSQLPSKDQILKSTVGNIKSYQNVPRLSQSKLPPKESDQRISGSHRQITLDLKPQDNDCLAFITEDHHLADQDVSVVIKNQVFEPTTSAAKTDTSPESIIAHCLKRHTMEELNQAADIIIEHWRNFQDQKAASQRLREFEQTKSMLLPIGAQTRQTFVGQARRQTQPFHAVMKQRIEENAQVKKFMSFFQSAFILVPHPIYFYRKLFTDVEPTLWILADPNLRVQCPQKYLTESMAEETSELDFIRKVLQNHNSIMAMQVVCSIQLSNHSRKIQIRFSIDNFYQHHDDIQDYDNPMDLFDQLLNIYLKQEGMIMNWIETRSRDAVLFGFKVNESSQLLVSKILYLLSHKKYVKAPNGYKFRSEGPTIQYQVLEANNQLYCEKKYEQRQLLLHQSDIQLLPKSVVQTTKQRRKKREKGLKHLMSPLISSEEESNSLQKKGIIISNENSSRRQNSSETPRQFPSRGQLPSKLKTIIQQQDITDEDIVTLEMLDYLETYFPDFKFAPPSEYVPQTQPIIRRRQARKFTESYYFPPQPRKLQKEFKQYRSIYPQEYLILVMILKLEKCYYMVKLNDHLSIQQLSLKNTWEDHIPIDLGEIIHYEIGRNGYILDLLELQRQLQERVVIENCRVRLLPRDQQNLIKTTTFPFQQIWLDRREPTVDLLYLLQMHKLVYFDAEDFEDEHLCIKDGIAKIPLPKEVPKSKALIRITLSYEDINKHIARTFERTVEPSKDIQLFINFNSVLILKSQYMCGQMKLSLNSQNPLKDFRNESLTGRMSVFDGRHFSITLPFSQLEKFLHIACLDSAMKKYLLKYRLIMKRTLAGRTLKQNAYRKSVSQDIRFLLMQDKCRYEESFHYYRMKGLGNMFVQVRHNEYFLLNVLHAKSRTKVHSFLSYTLHPGQLKLRPWYTYSRLELKQTTENAIRKKYYLCNSYQDDRLQVGQQLGSRVVYKRVLRIQQHYFIMTVVLVMNSTFQIYLYNQHNARRFYFRIHQSDFQAMANHFLDYIFPLSKQDMPEIVRLLFEKWSWKEISSLCDNIRANPEQIRKKYRDFTNKRNKTLASQSSLGDELNENAVLFSRQSSLAINEVRKANIYSLLCKRKPSMFEKRLWEDLIRHIDVQANMVYLNSFKAELAELVFSHDRTINFLCYIPCTEIQQNFRWQPVRLRVYSYENFKNYDIPLDFRGKQLQLLKNSQALLREYMKSKRIPSAGQEYVKLNKQNDLELEPKGHQLLYKGIFTRVYNLLMGVYYEQEVFRIRIWKLGMYIDKKYTIEEAELKIPYITQLLKVDPLEAGRRLSLAFRTQLLQLAFLNF